MEQQKKIFSRKAFIKTTSAGILGTSLMIRNLAAFTGDNKPVRVPLGHTGMTVTPLCFGASRAQSPAVLLMALDKGINFIDTGRQYGHGRNEEMIGKILQDQYKEVIIQSKVKVVISATGKALRSKTIAGKIRGIMQKSLDESLKALRRDILDIWLCHGPEREEILFHDEVMKFFSDVKSQGLIKAHGFSAHSHQTEFLHRANALRFYDVVMVGYNHKGSMVHSLTGIYRKFDNQGIERELAVAHNRGIGIIAMKTCSGGPYAPAPATEPSFPLAVKWVLNKPFVDATAVAMANFDQINEHTSLLI